MAEDKVERLRARLRGQRQLVVGTVGLSVLSLAGVGVVAAAAAHEPTGSQEKSGSSASTAFQPEQVAPGDQSATSPGSDVFGSGGSSGMVRPTRQRPRGTSSGS